MIQDEKRYVRQDDKDNPFPLGEANWVNCANCGQALLLAPGDEPYCNGKDATGCEPAIATE